LSDDKAWVIYVTPRILGIAPSSSGFPLGPPDSELSHVTKAKRTVAHKLLLIVASLALFATACGGGGPSSEQSSAAAEAASSNEATLVLTSDVASTQLLNIANGTISQLSDVVTGDRPVLLWYWSPN